MRTQSLRRGIGAYFLCLLIVTSGFAWFNAKISQGWAIGDWLINYSGGFIRRGLTGQIILELGRMSHIPLAWVVAFVQMALYCFISLVIYLLLREVRWGWPILALLLSPATLAFQVLDPPGGFRKEIILFAALALLVHLALHRTGQESTNWLAAHPLLASLLLIVLTQICILSHEATLFFLPYLFAVAFISVPTWRRSILICIAPAILALCSFLAAAMHQGSWQTAEAVCRSVGGTQLVDNRGVCGGAIFYLTHNAAFAEENVRQLFTASDYPLLYGVGIVLSLAPAVYLLFCLLRKTTTRRNATVVGIAFAVAFCDSVPLYFVATDWGRWIYMHAVCLLMLLLLIDRKPADQPSIWPFPSMTRARLTLSWIALMIYATCWTLPAVGIYSGRLGYPSLYHYLSDYKNHTHANWSGTK